MKETILIILFIIVIICDCAIHEDYKKFQWKANDIYKADIKLVETTPSRNEIMPSCFIGNKH